MARRHPATARLNGSVGASFCVLLPLMLEAMCRSRTNRTSAQRDVDGGFRQLRAEAALIELGNDGPLQLVALVEERQPEREAEVLEDLGVLRPGDHGARAHDGRDVAVHEGVAG